MGDASGFYPEVDMIWGITREYIMVLSKVIFQLLQDGCRPSFVVCPCAEAVAIWIVWRWVASILLPEGSYKPAKPSGSDVGAVWETSHLQTTLMKWAFMILPRALRGVLPGLAFATTSKWTQISGPVSRVAGVGALPGAPRHQVSFMNSLGPPGAAW